MTTSQQEPELTDEQILELTQQIKDKDAQSVPLVCQKDPMSALEEEFKDNEPFLRKVKNLKKSGCDFIRKCRGDGNCFFRAFAFAWFESMLRQNESAYAEALAKLEATPELLKQAGFQELAYEDFYEATLERFKQLPSLASDPDMLLVYFQSDEISNAIVMHLRFVASAYLKTHAAEYENFLVIEAISIDEFCSTQVEAFGSESDNLQIIALSKALGIPVSVFYLDGGSSEHVNEIKFPGNDGEQDETARALQLIYRPGHYDILYGSFMPSEIGIPHESG